jgi:hypothetical protein
MRGARRLMPLVLLVAALSAGCGSDEPRPVADNSRSATTPTEVPPEEILAKARLAALLDESQMLDDGSVDSGYSLEDVEYSSKTDAAASFWDCRKHLKDNCTTAILTTRDNWAYASGIAIRESVADLVDFQPVGEGSVVIKADDQIKGRSFPPFVLRPDATTELLRVAKETRDPTADSVALFDAIGESEWDPGFGRGPWAVDVDTAEAFALRLSPPSCCSSNWQLVAARPGALVTYGEYDRHVGDGIWRFAQSTDGARTWRTTEVRLPLGDKWIYSYTDDYLDAVGPGHLQAIAMMKEEQDGPRYLWELWVTDDERAFHRVPLSRTPKDLGGVAFASDGGLLLVEETGHRLWRLARGATEIEPVPDAPKLSEPSTLFNSGGVIVALTGARSLAISTDGSTWTQVNPGR